MVRRNIKDPNRILNYILETGRIINGKIAPDKKQKNMNLDVPMSFNFDDDDDNEKQSKPTWKYLPLDMSKIASKKFTDVKEIPTYDINKILVMKDGNEGYLAAYSDTDFYAYRYSQINNAFPRVYKFDNFNTNKFLENLFKYHKLPENSYTKLTYQDNEKPRISAITIIFYKDMYLSIDSGDTGTLYYDAKYEIDKDSFLYTLLGLLKTVKKPKVAKNKIYIVYRNNHGFDKIGFNVNKIKVDLAQNYNDEFELTAENIIAGLNDKHKTNLVILSGDPGTGKTTFIRYLTSKLKKNIIFISPDMVDSITDPAFIPFLMKNNDSILIIEDAEPALEKRNQGGRSSAVSNVLNLTDGLLSDCLKISIVATFNTGIKNIDEALTRPGRLLMNYKFEKLSIEKSKKLLEKLGHKNVEVKTSMTLAEIYFYGTDNNMKKKNEKIGF